MSDEETPFEGEPTEEHSYEVESDSSEYDGSDDDGGESGEKETGGLAELLKTKGIPDAKVTMRSPRPMVAKESPLAEVKEKAPASGAFDPQLAEDFKRWKAEKLAAGEDPAKVRGEANAVAAQLRIKDREAKVLKAKLIQIEKERAAAALAAQTPAEELPDPNVDPGAYAVAKIDRIERMLKEREDQQHVQREMETYLGEVAQARNLAIQYRENNPPVYDAAVVHLAESAYEELADNVDRLVENGTINLQQELHPQIVQLVAKMMSSEMVRAAKAGQNPGELLYAMAVRRGFVPSQAEYVQQQAPVVQAAVPAPAPAAPKPKVDARKMLAEEQARRGKAGNLAEVPSAGPGRMNLSRLAELEVDEYLAATKGVPMKDLFKDKLIQGSR